MNKNNKNMFTWKRIESDASYQPYEEEKVDTYRSDIV